MSVIDVQGLTKHYGEVRAVDGLDLQVEAGEFFGVLGPNGAGKTTTLECIEGIRQPDSGTISVFGESPWPRNTGLVRRIGVQHQATAFFEMLTAREQLEVFADLYAAPRARAGALLEEVGLGDFANHQTKKLSGGQQQRLSIAAALVHEPEMVFLDEPSAALDPQARRNLWDLLKGVNGDGRTVVLTTHYMDEAEYLCDRVAIIDHGKILAVDTPANLVRGLDAPTRITLPDTAIGREDAERLVGGEAVSVDNGSLTMTTRDPAPVLVALAERDALTGLQVRGATLEDVFLNLTGRELRA
ncbi:MAG TPA: ABC transporter ATP-binding protein [Dermatophilaceae bacterium]|nr:ABC transporter ATP-binding protein [Dermatophilaceae bacterium]